MLGKRKRCSRKQSCASSVQMKRMSWREINARVALMQAARSGKKGALDAFGDEMGPVYRSFGKQGAGGSPHIYATPFTSSKQLAQLADPAFTEWWTPQRVRGLLLPFAVRNLCHAGHEPPTVEETGLPCIKSRISIRMISMFMNNFAKERCIHYKVADDSGVHVHEPHHLYTQIMGEYTRRGFDLVNREARIYVQTGSREDGTAQLWPTSVPQLNSLRIIWTTGLLFHILALEPVLTAWYEETRRSYHRRKKMAGSKRVPFVRSSSSHGSVSVALVEAGLPVTWRVNDDDLQYIVRPMPEQMMNDVQKKMNLVS